MRGKICAVYGCSNYEIQKNSRSFFTFPMDKNICDQWVLKCRRSDLDEHYKKEGTSQGFRRTYRICSDHFLISDYRNPRLFSQGLKRGTVPSQNLLFQEKESYTTSDSRRSYRKRKRDAKEPGEESITDNRRECTSGLASGDDSAAPEDDGDCNNDAPSPEPVPSNPFCRLCGLKKDALLPIFSQEGSDLHLQQKIRACLPLTISEDDGLSMNVCRDCVTQLESCYKFITSCCKAVVQLLSVLGTDPVWCEQKYFSRNIELDTSESRNVGEDEDNIEEHLPTVGNTRDSETQDISSRNTVCAEGEPPCESSSRADIFNNESENIVANNDNNKSEVVLKSLQSDFPGKSPETEIYMCMLCYKKIHGGNYPAPRSKRKCLDSSEYHLDQFESEIQLNIIHQAMLNKRQNSNSNDFNVVPPQCKFCEKLFFSRLQLIQHELTHPQAKLFICENSGQTYPQKKKSVYFCEVCGETMRHICRGSAEAKLHHRENSLKTFNCEGCGKNFCNRLRF